MVLFPLLTAPSSALPQLPPTAKVPASLVEKVTSGVESLPGVLTGVTSATVGANASTNTEAKDPTLLSVVLMLLPDESRKVPELGSIVAPRDIPSRS